MRSSPLNGSIASHSSLYKEIDLTVRLTPVVWTPRPNLTPLLNYDPQDTCYLITGGILFYTPGIASPINKEPAVHASTSEVETYTITQTRETHTHLRTIFSQPPRDTGTWTPMVLCSVNVPASQLYTRHEVGPASIKRHGHVTARVAPCVPLPLWGGRGGRHGPGTRQHRPGHPRELGHGCAHACVG